MVYTTSAILCFEIWYDCMKQRASVTISRQNRRHCLMFPSYPDTFQHPSYPKGGVHRTPPSISVVYQPIWMKFLHNVMYDISFPKNIGLALYDLYDVSYDVIMTFWKTDFREFSSYLFLISETKFFGTKFLHQFVA